MGTIDDAAHNAALEALSTMLSQSFRLLPVMSAHFRRAARFADQHRLGLRAPDALHIAIADEQRATLCTMDKRLAKAGETLCLSIRLV
jgi:uncharacterized protein